MPLPPYITLDDQFGVWLHATNNLTSHVDNTSAYVLVTQNATPRVSSGNVAINGTATITNLILQGAVSANGSNGSANQVLTTNGSGVYWANASGGGGSATANSSGGNGAIQFYNGSNLGSSSKLIVADDGYASKIAVGNATANVTMHGWYLWGPALIANSGSTTIILGAENNTYDGSDNGSINSGKLQGNSISLQSQTGTVAIFKTIKNINPSDNINAYDAGKLLRCNSASAASLYFTGENGGGSYLDTTMLGAKWYLFQEGAGQISVLSDGVPGFTVLFRGPTTTTGQYSLLTAELITANATHREFATTLSYPSTASPTFAGLLLSGNAASANVTIGNATSNTVLTGQALLMRANTTVNALANATTVQLRTSGSDLTLNSSAVVTGNSTVNTSHTTTTLTFQANTTVNTIANATTVKLSTSTANTEISATSLTTPALTVAGYSTVQGLLEKATIASTAANGTINFDTSTQSVVFYTANTANNWTVNLRGNSSTTLNAVMSTGQSLTLVFAVTNGSTAYYANAHQIDGANVTPKWQDGAAPFAGSANAIDVYVYTVMKTAASTYTLLASRTKFA